jgi:hypothetical protein
MSKDLMRDEVEGKAVKVEGWVSFSHLSSLNRLLMRDER